MTHYLQNILAEPGELRRCLDYTLGDGNSALQQAADGVRDAQAIYITGIGSSWHAGMAVQSLFDAAGKPALLADASELLHFTQFAPNACLIVLSRSGKSVEIVRLLDKAEASGTRIIGITNTPGSPLAHRATVTLPLNATFDRNVSVTMYSALTLVGGLLATQATFGIKASLAISIREYLTAARNQMSRWQETIAESNWFSAELPTYFLARGSSLASCHEARLLWEEAAKIGATAMTTGGFRHGPQEMIAGGARIGLWLAPAVLRDQDLRLASDLRRYGVPVLLIGQNLPNTEDFTRLELPPLVPEFSTWQFLVDVIPAQLASEHLARQRGADCDGFAICPYIIEAEGGLCEAGAADRLQETSK